MEILLNFFCTEIGKPYSIITDHGTQFKGKKMEGDIEERRNKDIQDINVSP